MSKTIKNEVDPIELLKAAHKKARPSYDSYEEPEEGVKNKNHMRGNPQKNRQSRRNHGRNR